MLVRNTTYFKAVWSMAGILVLVLGVVMLPPLAFAQEATQTAEPLQGEGQGTNQGVQNGGPTLAELGITLDPETGLADTSSLGEDDPRQGANQGVQQGQETSAQTALSAGTSTTTATAENTETGSDSTNTSSVTTDSALVTSVTNTSDTTTDASVLASTGVNTASENTGSSSVTTGDASIGVQQVTVDNLTTAGSYGEIEHNLAAGGQSGDLVLSFDPTSDGASLDQSFRSTNTVTGSGSDNTSEITSSLDVLTEVENDGTIDTFISASAVSGENDASQNTGNASVTTGTANVAATVLNFLNATVVDGALWLSVSDVFGDLAGNVVIPESALAYLGKRERELLVDATNSQTGSDSTNSLDVDVTNTRTTTLENEATVDTTMAVDAITGENTATQNTGGATIATGDVATTTNAITLANMNVVDGSLGVVIVNALNKWVGYLLGSNGSWAPIDHDFSTIAVSNSQTGAFSDNTATVDVTNTETTAVTNTARVSTTLDLEAVTGKNTVLQNTGNAAITTGDARVSATVINVVNTNVVRGGFFVAIVNVFGNWFGDLLFGGHSVGALAASTGGSGIAVEAMNDRTGSDSVNTVDVDVDNDDTVDVDNDAVVTNTFLVSADTGHNDASRNTGLAAVDTGDVVATMHARTAANVTVAGVGSGWSDITADLTNATTGADSTNTIDVTVNDERHVAVLNDATVDTAIGAVANTGFNTASRNTLGGLITTGSASIRPLIDSLLNQTWLLGAEYGDDPSLAASLTNQTTGSGSTNTTSFLPTVLTEVDLTNSAVITTDVAAAATTGGNEASRNTGGGAIRSGTAAVGGALDAVVNQTELQGQIPGSFDLAIDNSATILNDAAILASSGGNDASRNTGTLSLAAGTPGSGASPALPAASAGVLASGSAPSSGSGSSSLAVSGTGGGVVESSSGERSLTAKKPVAKQKTAKRAGRVAGRVQTASGRHGAVQRVGVPLVRPASIARTALGVREAQAAASGPSITAVPLPAALSSESASVAAVARRAWPWVAFVVAAGILGRLVVRRYARK